MTDTEAARVTTDIDCRKDGTRHAKTGLHNIIEHHDMMEGEPVAVLARASKNC